MAANLELKALETKVTAQGMIVENGNWGEATVKIAPMELVESLGEIICSRYSRAFEILKDR